MGGHNTHRHTTLHRTAAGQINAVTFSTDTLTQLAGHGRVDQHLFNTSLIDGITQFFAVKLSFLDDNLAGSRVGNSVGRITAKDPFTQRLFTKIICFAHPNAVIRFAILIHNDDILGHVHQTAGQIAGIGRTQRGVGQTFARPVGGDEILQCAQPVAEVRQNGHGNDSTLRIGHQATHPRQLRNGAKTTLG